MVSKPERQLLGFPTIYLDTVESTNQYAAELNSKSNPNEGTVVIARHQTHGKGQIGRKWEADPGKNLTLSIILKPGFLRVDQQFALTMMSSIAVYDFLDPLTSGEISIKWPNDIMWKKKKIAGILIQNQILSKTITGSILGVGVNINQTEFPEAAERAVSLSQITSKTYDLGELTENLLISVERYYIMLKSQPKLDLIEKYTSLLFLKDEESNFEEEDGTRFAGIIRGVRKRGELIIDMGDVGRDFQFNELRYIL